MDKFNKDNTSLFVEKKQTIVSVNDEKSIKELEREILGEIKKEHKKAQALIERAYKKYENALHKIKKPYVSECVWKYYKEQISHEHRKQIGTNKSKVLGNIRQIVNTWSINQILNYINNGELPEEENLWEEITNNLK